MNNFFFFSSAQYGIDTYDAEKKLMSDYELLKAIFEATKNDPNSKSLLENDKRRSKITELQIMYRKTTAASTNFKKFNKFSVDPIVKELFGINDLFW